jgi:hypothetical protein
LATTPAITDNFCKIAMAQKVLVAGSPATGDPSSVSAARPESTQTAKIRCAERLTIKNDL